MIFNSKTLKILILSHIFTLFGANFIQASFRRRVRSMSEGNLSSKIDAKSPMHRGSSTLGFDTPLSDDGSSSAYFNTPVLPRPGKKLSSVPGFIKPEDLEKMVVDCEQPLAFLIDHLAYSLLLAQTGVEREVRNRLPKLCNLLFKYSENVKIDNLVDINIPKDLITFSYILTDCFKSKSIEDILFFIEEFIFNKNTIEKSFESVFFWIKENKTSTKNLNNRKFKRWLKNLLSLLFSLKDNQNKRVLGSFIFIDFLSKVLFDYQKNIDENFDSSEYIFFEELYFIDSVEYKRLIFLNSIESRYEAAVSLFSKDLEKHQGLDLLMRYILFFLNKYEENFIGADIDLEIYAKNAEFLTRFLEEKIKVLESRYLDFVYERILNFLLESFNGFIPQTYHYLASMAKRISISLGLESSDLDRMIFVNDEHMKKIVLEKKDRTRKLIPQGGHLDVELPYIVNKVPEELVDRTDRIEVEDSRFILEDPETGVSLVDWVINKIPVEDLRRSCDFNYAFDKKTSTLFPTCYGANFHEYISKIYSFVTGVIERDVTVFEAESNRKLDKKAFIIKHPVHYGCSDDYCSHSNEHIYVLLIISKKFGFDSITTLYPLGCFVLDYDELTQDDEIFYFDGDFRQPDEYAEKTINYFQIQDIIDQKIKDKPLLKKIRSSDYFEIDRMLFEDFEGNKFRFIKAINGIYVKKGLG